MFSIREAIKRAVQEVKHCYTSHDIVFVHFGHFFLFVRMFMLTSNGIMFIFKQHFIHLFVLYVCFTLILKSTID